MERPSTSGVTKDLHERIMFRLRNLKGVLDVRLLTQDEKEEILRLEKKAQERGAVQGMMDFLNEGTFEALSRDETWVILFDKTFREPSRPWVVMVDEDGEILGEWVGSKKLEEMKKRKDVIFMGPDFVLYKNKLPKGKPYFLMPPLPFPELQEFEELEDIVSGSPCTPSDEYLKRLLGCEKSKDGTLLIGYNMKN